MELQQKECCSSEPSSIAWNSSDQKPGKTKQATRRNPWGNRSYADLITQAIQNAPEQRLTLSQIYEWMVKNIPHFKDKGENNSSAGWKNSIRHNLSLHTRFVRIQNDTTGKSSWWVIDPDGGDGRVTRRRPTAKGDRSRTYRRQRPKTKPQPPPSASQTAQDRSFAAATSSFGPPVHFAGAGSRSLSQYFPRDPTWTSDYSHMQRGHSSSSSSEEVAADISRMFRTVTPEFHQPCSPQCERSSSGFSSPSSEGDPGDAFAICGPSTYTLSTFQDGMGRWVRRSPRPPGHCSPPVASLANPWGGLNCSFQYKRGRSLFQEDAISESNPYYRRDNYAVSSSLPTSGCGYGFAVPSPTGSHSRYFSDNDFSRMCNHELENDSDSVPSPEVSSQRAVSFEDFCDVSPHVHENYDMPAYVLSPFGSDGGSSYIRVCQSPGRARSYSMDEILDEGCSYDDEEEEEDVDDELPLDLRSCHIIPGIECNVREVIGYELEVEGQLEFLDCFGDIGQD